VLFSWVLQSTSDSGTAPLAGGAQWSHPRAQRAYHTLAPRPRQNEAARRNGPVVLSRGFAAGGDRAAVVGCWQSSRPAWRTLPLSGRRIVPACCRLRQHPTQGFFRSAQLLAGRGFVHSRTLASYLQGAWRWPGRIDPLDSPFRCGIEPSGPEVVLPSGESQNGGDKTLPRAINRSAEIWPYDRTRAPITDACGSDDGVASSTPIQHAASFLGRGACSPLPQPSGRMAFPIRRRTRRPAPNPRHGSASTWISGAVRGVDNGLVVYNPAMTVSTGIATKRADAVNATRPCDAGSREDDACERQKPRSRRPFFTPSMKSAPWP